MTAITEIQNPRRAHVVDVAMELFWRHGYDGVSIGDLVEATGMNRYALYQAFGGKKDIFMAVLKTYADDAFELIREVLNDPGITPLEAARVAIIKKMLDPEIFPAGCLICTTAVDVAAKDSDIAAFMEKTTQQMGAAFSSAWARAQKEGKASLGVTPEGFAEIATAVYFSTGVQARMGRSREDLLAAVDKVLESLG